MFKLPLFAARVFFALTCLSSMLTPGKALPGLAAEQTPSQFYMQYHQKALIVSSPKALLPWRCKESIARDEPMSDDEVEQVYPMIKDMMPKTITVVSEEIKGDRATLKVTGNVPGSDQPVKATAARSASTTGTAARSSASKTVMSTKVADKPTEKPANSEPAMGVVLLLKENGQWKLDHESWTSR